MEVHVCHARTVGGGRRARQKDGCSGPAPEPTALLRVRARVAILPAMSLVEEPWEERV
jgi:hypothetical protein